MSNDTVNHYAKMIGEQVAKSRNAGLRSGPIQESNKVVPEDKDEQK